MRPEVCLICNDARHFETKVWDAERISNQLSRYADRHTHITDRMLWTQLCTDRQHTHFMCGMCMKVDEGKLRKVEEKLAKAVYSICKGIESGNEYPVGEILRLLQGHYPLMYKCVERSWYKAKGEK